MSSKYRKAFNDLREKLTQERDNQSDISSKFYILKKNCDVYELKSEEKKSSCFTHLFFNLTTFNNHFLLYLIDNTQLFKIPSPILS